MNIALNLTYDSVIFVLALILASFYGFWGRTALDYPSKDLIIPRIKLAARIHVFLYHFLGGFIGVYILSKLYQEIFLNNQVITPTHLLSFILGFMGVMGYIPGFTNNVLQNISEIINKVSPLKK